MTRPVTAAEREKEKRRLAQEFEALDPKAAIVASMVALDIETAKQQVISDWREVAAELEHASIVASFMADPEAERMVLNTQLLDWVAENEEALVAYAPGSLAAPWFRAFSPERRERQRTAIIASSATPNYAPGTDPTGSKRGSHLIARAEALRDARVSAGFKTRAQRAAEA